MVKTRTLVIFLIALAALSAPAWAVGPDSQLAVEVSTDRASYQTGENISIQVRTFLDGEPAPATLVQALLTVTLPDGRVAKKDIRNDFEMISPGVYVTRGVVDGPGARELEVRAAAKRRVTCKCKTVVFKSTGFAAFEVAARPLELSISTDKANPTICDPLKVVLHLNGPAHVRLLAVLPDGTVRDLVIPGWLGAGQHWIELPAGKLDVLGTVTLKAVAADKYGGKAEASAQVTLDAGVCEADDC